MSSEAFDSLASAYERDIEELEEEIKSLTAGNKLLKALLLEIVIVEEGGELLLPKDGLVSDWIEQRDKLLNGEV